MRTKKVRRRDQTESPQADQSANHVFLAWLFAEGFLKSKKRRSTDTHKEISVSLPAAPPTLCSKSILLLRQPKSKPETAIPPSLFTIFAMPSFLLPWQICLPFSDGGKRPSVIHGTLLAVNVLAKLARRARPILVRVRAGAAFPVHVFSGSPGRNFFPLLDLCFLLRVGFRGTRRAHLRALVRSLFYARAVEEDGLVRWADNN